MRRKQSAQRRDKTNVGLQFHRPRTTSLGYSQVGQNRFLVPVGRGAIPLTPYRFSLQKWIPLLDQGQEHFH